MHPTPSPIPYLTVVQPGNDFATELWANLWGGLVTGVIAGLLILVIQVFLQRRAAAERASVDWFPVRQKVAQVMLAQLDSPEGVVELDRWPLGEIQQIVAPFPLAIWAKQDKRDSSVRLTKSLVELAYVRYPIAVRLHAVIDALTSAHHVPDSGSTRSYYGKFLKLRATGVPDPAIPNPSWRDFPSYLSGRTQWSSTHFRPSYR